MLRHRKMIHKCRWAQDYALLISSQVMLLTHGPDFAWQRSRTALRLRLEPRDFLVVQRLDLPPMQGTWVCTPQLLKPLLL